MRGKGKEEARFVIFLFGLMSCSTMSSFAANEAETFVVALSNPGAPAALEIDSSFMQLVIIGAERDDMEFRIERKQDERAEKIEIDIDIEIEILPGAKLQNYSRIAESD